MATAATVPPAQDLGAVLGLRGPSIAWGRVFAFFLAWMFCDVPAILFYTLRLGTGHWMWPSFWISNFFGALLLTLLLVATFSSIRGDVGPILVASIAYTLLSPVVLLLSTPLAALSRAHILSTLPMPLFGKLLVLLALALTVRHFRPRWLGLWIGATAGFVLSSVLSTLWATQLHGASAHLTLNPEALAAALVTATLFVLIFEGLSNLLG